MYMFFRMFRADSLAKDCSDIEVDGFWTNERKL